MKKLRESQAGFGHIELVLVVVIVGVIGFVGWYVYQARKNSNNAYNKASSALTNERQTLEKTETSEAQNKATTNKTITNKTITTTNSTSDEKCTDASKRNGSNAVCTFTTESTITIKGMMLAILYRGSGTSDLAGDMKVTCSEAQACKDKSGAYFTSKTFTNADANPSQDGQSSGDVKVVISKKTKVTVEVPVSVKQQDNHLTIGCKGCPNMRVYDFSKWILSSDSLTIEWKNTGRVTS